jgi:hypothetical protein
VAVRPASLPYWLTAASPIRPSLSLLAGGVGPIFSLPVLLMLWAALRRI